MNFTWTIRVVGGTVLAGALLFGTAPVALADEIRDSQWPLKAFGAEAVWKESTGKGVIVAMLDSSVDGSHPDLRKNVLPGIKLVDGDTADQGSTELADHGTTMASIIAGHGHGPGGSEGVKGLAPDAKILPIDIYKEDEKLYAVSGSLHKGIRYAVDHGASIINLSISTSAVSSSEKAAIAYAFKKDVLLIAGTGNSRSNLEVGDAGLASAPGVVAVGAVKKNGVIWKDSSFGPAVMLTAPGAEIMNAATSKPYMLTSGTSNATAYVSGAAALLRSKFPDLTAGQIINRLVKTAAPPSLEKGAGLPDPYYGYGIIRPHRALTENIAAGPKSGPLRVPDLSLLKTETATPDARADQDAEDAQTARNTGISMTVIDVVFIAFIASAVIGIIVAVVIGLTRRNRRNGPPPGGPGGFGPGAPGFPIQPNPYQQQSAPPGPPNWPPSR